MGRDDQSRTSPGGWRLTHLDGDNRHVWPPADVVLHTLNLDGECVCGPRCEIIPRVDAPDIHMYVHHSLDGRELDEEDHQ